MRIDRVYKEVAKKLGLDAKDVKEANIIYWKFFRKSIESLPLKEDLSEEDFSKLKTSFNIPSIGKLFCTYDRYLRIRKKLKLSQDAKNTRMHTSS